MKKTQFKLLNTKCLFCLNTLTLYCYGGLNLKQIGFDLKTLQVILVSFVLGGYFCLGD